MSSFVMCCLFLARTFEQEAGNLKLLNSLNLFSKYIGDVGSIPYVFSICSLDNIFFDMSNEIKIWKKIAKMSEQALYFL